MKVNETKSTHVTFTTRRATCPSVKISDVQLSQSDEVKYLGFRLNRRLTWHKHIQFPDSPAFSLVPLLQALLLVYGINFSCILRITISKTANSEPYPSLENDAKSSIGF
jgi:hypothetical protein